PGQKTYGYRRRISRMVDAALHDRELVATEASHRIGLAHDVAQSLAHDLEQGVPHRMSEGIIDAFELVEIEAKHGARVAARDAMKRVSEPLAEQDAIRQI